MIIIGMPMIRPIIVRQAMPPKITSSRPIVFRRALTESAATISTTAMIKINHCQKSFISELLHKIASLTNSHIMAYNIGVD